MTIGVSDIPNKWDVDTFVKRRAEKIGKIAADMLVDGETSLPAIEAFKFAHLILRGPREFLARFKGSSLEIDSGEVELFICENEVFHGSHSYLLTEEERLISTHNLNVSLLGTY